MLRIETPQLEASRGGLLSAVEVVKTPSSEINFAEQFEGVLDGTPSAIKLFREQVGEVTKTPIEAQNFDSYGFTAYTLVENSLLYVTDSAQQVEAAHKRGLSVAVEKGVESLLLSVNALDLTPTPGTPVTNARAALGILEQYAGANSGFLPVIHTNRLGASLLRDLKIDESKWTIHTKQGSPVANGAGYEGATIGAVTPTAGQAWVYVTTGLFIMQYDHDTKEGRNLATNTASALVESDFLIANAGVVGAVLLGS